VNDKELLKLLEAGVGVDAAAKQLSLSANAVVERVKEYLEWGILRCAGERQIIDWKAYGKWARNRKQSVAA